MHDILSNWNRRSILYALQAHDDPISLDAVAAQLVGWRRGDEDPAPCDDDAVRRTRERLLGEHLLKMDEFGVVAYDSRTDAVRLADGMEVAVDPPWRRRPDEPQRSDR